LLKKANDIWDDFTTGNKHKNRRDFKLEVIEQKKKGLKKTLDDPKVLKKNE
jgi:hypothetical protein